ncbi:MAG: family 20 glycosylhydrolase, partial [Lachnospiraceae bacterium]|nr:family 20 glycosylhydrolase [Lachnospiraceae bacterium]
MKRAQREREVTEMILLPLPKQMEEKEGALMLRMSTMIMMDASCPQGAGVYARQLKEEILTWAGMNLDISRGCFREGDILLQVDPSLGDQRYTLKIEDGGAFLCGGSLSALGWAVQTLRQIVRQSAGLLPHVSIDDEPDLKNRGFYHDVTRGRIQTLENLKKLADTMAFYKMNQLQLYVEQTYLFRDLTELWREGTPLTAEEIMELDQYCFERGIELVPSIATFGHLCDLLSTRSYAHLCELEDSAGKRFSYRDRMAHHTVNVSDPASIALIKSMVEEYMQLFMTDKFNICADETFDLGKGKSAGLAAEKGTGKLYLDYIKELFEFLIQKGKKPMFWGDIISGHPELYSELPKDVVCLTWGYASDQSDREAKTLHKVGAVQYLCPGTRGWNTWVNMMRGGYDNITRMCSYARQYDAVGVLNTDWGDYGHINHPAFTIPGLIFGAVCSWGENVPEYEELSRQISILEYGDASGRLVDVLDQVNALAAFGWHQAVTVKEWTQDGVEQEKVRRMFEEANLDGIAECNTRIGQLEADLRIVSRSMDSKNRRIVDYTHVALEATRVWNETGIAMAGIVKGEKPENSAALASELER